MATEAESSIPSTTKLPEHRYTFKWVVHNFSKMPERLDSPSVSIVPGYPKVWKVRIECKSDETVCISLHYTSRDKETLPVLLKALVCDSKGNALESLSMLHTYKDEDAEFPLCFLKLSAALPEDRLHISCEIKAHSHDLSSNVAMFEESLDDDITKLQNDFQKMLNEGKGTDIQIITGDRPLKVHEYLLQFRLPAFNMIHADEIKKRKVSLEPVSYNVVKSFFDYVYTGRIDNDVSFNNAVDIYELAWRYGLKRLKEKCVTNIIKDLNVRNVSEVLHKDYFTKDEELMKHCISFAHRHLTELQDTPEWKTLIAIKPHLEEEVKNFTPTGDQ